MTSGSFSVDLLAAELMRDEGRRSRIYTDASGKITGGIGHNFTDNRLSDEVIAVLYTEDLRNVCNGLDEHIPWWREHPDSVQRALINMAFNLGVEGLMKWPFTLQMIRTGSYGSAAQAIRQSAKWRSQVGDRVDRIADLILEAANVS